MNKKKYKKYVAMQLIGLGLLLCGQWPIAMAVFVISHIMSAKPSEEPVQRAVQSEPEPVEDDTADYWKEEVSRYKRPESVQKPCDTQPKAKRKIDYGEPLNRVKEKVKAKFKGDPREGLKSVRTMVLEDDGSMPTYKPNAFVIRGVKGLPLLCDYDKNGKPTDAGMELHGGGWVKDICGPLGVEASSVVLVHAVKGESSNLIKALQVHEVQRKGKPITVAEMARDGVLLEVAESLRESYIEEVGV